MLQRCLPSVSTLEAMLNSYASVPPCDWVDSLSPEVYQVSAIGLPGFTLRFSASPLLLFSSSHLVLCPSLRSTPSSGTRCVSGAACLACCSISVATPCAGTWAPAATRRSVRWTFPALSDSTCCCVTTAPSTDITG